MKPIKCISAGFLSGILLMSNIGVHAENVDSLWVSQIKAQQSMINQTLNNTADTIGSITDGIEIEKQPDVEEYVNKQSFVDNTETIVAYVEQPVENVISYEEFMQMLEEISAEPVQETADPSVDVQANYDAALAAYNEALAQYESAQQALTAASVPLPVIEQMKDEEGNFIDQENEIIPDTSAQQAALESASLNLVNAEANLHAARQALNNAQQNNSAYIIEKTIADEVEDTAPLIETEINQEVIEQTEPTLAEKVTGTTSDGLTYESTDGKTAIITGHTKIMIDVVIPQTVNGYTVTEIGDYAFENCTSLQSISFPNSLTKIDYQAFKGCTALTNIVLPEGLTSLGSHSFADCVNLSTVTIPVSLKKASSPFYGCAKLVRIVLPEGMTATPYSMFFSNTCIKEIILPSSITEIGDCTFQGCTGIESINLPNGLTKIGYQGFKACENLTKIVLPEGLTELGSYCFEDCINLSSVNIPVSLTSALGAFNDCTKLVRFVLPEGMTTTPSGLFSGNSCVKEVVLPSTITRIANSTFNRSTGIQSIDLPDGLIEIGDYAFQGCTGIESINLPNGLTKIGFQGFKGCENLTKIVLPEGLTELGSYCFEDCVNLSSVNIPVSLIRALGAFNGCTKLVRIVLPEGMTTTPSSIFSGNTCVKEVVLPSSITEIGDYTFQGCTGIESINLPNGLTKIGYQGFKACENLTKIVLPEGLTELGSYCFEDCINLSSVNIPVSLTSALGAFNDCTKLVRFVLPEGMTTTPSGLFSGNSCVKEVVLPSTITKIANSTFNGCTEIQSIDLPSGLTEIGDYAFQGCTKIKSIDLPNTLIKIDYQAFKGCTALTSIVLPEGVTELGSYCFKDCLNLKNIFCPTSLSRIAAGNFVDIDGLNLISEYNCYATMYAVQNNISFKVLKGHKDDDSCVLDRSVTSLNVNFDGMSVNGYIPVTLSYRIKDIWVDKIKNAKLDIYLPANAELKQDSLNLYNTILENYTLKNRNLIIPINQQEGILKFLLKVKEQGRLLGYFSLSMLKENVSTYEVIDLINEPTRNFLTINAPEITGIKTVTVDGLAPASANVNVYINDQLQATVKASKAGVWSTNLQLTTDKNNEVFRLKASINDSDIVERKVVYYAGNPSITGFTMSYNDNKKSVDLLNTSKIKPTISVVPGNPFNFELTFDYPESIDKVYVTSLRNNVKKYLEATFDSNSGTFKTDGYFDPNDKKYVPGLISYEYTLKQEEKLVDPNMEIKTVDGIDTLADKFTVITDSDKEFTANLDLSEYTEDAANAALQYDFKIFDGIEDPSFIESDFYQLLNSDSDSTKNYTLTGLNGITYTLSTDASSKGVVTLIKDIASSGITGFAIDYVVDSEVIPQLNKALETVSTVLDPVGFALEYGLISWEMDELREEVMSSTSYDTEEERQEALKKIDELEFDQQVFTLLSVGAPLILGVGIGSAAMTGPAILLSGMLFVIGKIAPIFWNHRIAGIKGQNYKVRFMIDPSGYVYDIDTNERLEDVKTTAYWIEYDESEGFWDNMPADAEYGILWDGSEYNIENPMFSGIDGKYGWDVPEGWWRVKYEKEGYNTTWSNWMPVPPIQTEVNIGMKSTALPFTDVPKDAWYYSVAKECYETGLINGTSATTFSPMQEMTRAMVVTILWRMEGQPKVDFNNKFSDVSSKQWYATSVSWAEKAGVVHGYGDGTFKPDAAVTREQVAVMLANYAQYKGVYVPGTKKLNTYPDGYQVSTWAQAGMKWALTNGIISGNGAGYLNPKKSATRAEGAAMLLRMKNWL